MRVAPCSSRGVRATAVVAVALIAVACTGEAPGTSSEDLPAAATETAVPTPSTSSTPTASDSASPSPSPSLSPSPSETAAALAEGLLVASGEGVDLVPIGGEPRALTAIPASRAFHDGAGGVVFQGVAPPQPDAPSAAIMWLPPDGGEALTVVDDGAADAVQLRDAGLVGGAPTAVYTDRTGPDQPDTAEETLRALPLPDGPAREIAVVGGWESGATAVSFGGELFAVSHFAEASNWFSFLGLDGGSRQLDVNPLPEEQACVDSPACPRLVTVSASGDRLAWVEGDQVVLAATEGGGQRPLPLPPAEELAVLELELAGDTLVVNRIELPEGDFTSPQPGPPVRYDLGRADPQPIVGDEAAFTSVATGSS